MNKRYALLLVPLMASGIQPEGFIDAIKDNNLKKVKMLLASGKAHVNESFEGSTPLHFAAFVSAPEMVQELIKNHADLNVESPFHAGSTALIIAIGNGQFANAKVLINAGADVKKKGFYGQTALGMAEQRVAEDPRYQELVELLRAKGAKR